ncbi:MAG: flippase-like domain-containing protein [Rhodospirillaceae bacterium]|nr:flippase-like domain-containing protein [Rhodospirillaceae bacterium]
MRGRRLATLLLLAGLALLAGLLIHYDLPNIAEAFSAAGWGVAAVAAFHLVPLVADAAAWRILVPPPDRLPLAAAVRLRWMAESVNALLPTASVGGEFVRARLAAREGVRPTTAGASVIVDVTLGLITQAAFALIGLVLLARLDGAGSGLVLSIALGLGAFSLLAGLLLLVQHKGAFAFLTARIERVTDARRWPGLAAGGARLDRAIEGLYRRSGPVLRSGLWRMAGWILGAGEIWLALRFLGHPVDLADAVVVESLIQAVRTAAFLVPAGVGVQEGAFILVAGALGVPAAPALALALVKRAREILLGVPGLMAWQAGEATRLRRDREPSQSG